jgi:hypothetical protein
MLRKLFQMVRPAVIPSEVEGSCGNIAVWSRDSSTALRSAWNKKPEPNYRFGFLDFYPAGAVQVDLPFPFGKRRMTVAAESDFQ